MALTYNPNRFAVQDFDEARAIILTPEPGRTTDERWEQETPYLAELIGRNLALKTDDLILDYGCGVGRIAKELIERFGVRVLGVDISADMRALSPGYVASHRFSAVSPEIFRAMLESGLKVDGALAVWVLQHIFEPQAEIDRLYDALKSGSRFALVNGFFRAVPAIEQNWVNDGIDIAAAVGSKLSLVERGDLDPAYVGEVRNRLSYWAIYQR